MSLSVEGAERISIPLLVRWYWWPSTMMSSSSLISHNRHCHCMTYTNLHGKTSYFATHTISDTRFTCHGCLRTFKLLKCHRRVIAAGIIKRSRGITKGLSEILFYPCLSVCADHDKEGQASYIRICKLFQHQMQSSSDRCRYLFDSREVKVSSHNGSKRPSARTSATIEFG